MIMASMRNWLHGGPLEGTFKTTPEQQQQQPQPKQDAHKDKNKSNAARPDRVVVVHCKAGKGRSGTMACSYLISEREWAAEDALARFTERRMRPMFGAGVSIPSQLRWVNYVDRWTRGGKKFIDRPVEIVEVQIRGLRHGVKVSVEGFVDEGKQIKTFHTFTKDERTIVEGGAPGGTGIVDLVSDMAGYGVASASGDSSEIAEEADYGEIVGGTSKNEDKKIPTRSTSRAKIMDFVRSPSLLRKNGWKPKPAPGAKGNSGGSSSSSSTTSFSKPQKNGHGKTAHADAQQQSSSGTSTPADDPAAYGLIYSSPSEPGGRSVIFRPKSPVRVLTSDVNISLERRNRATSGLGPFMVTSVAHVWFNAFFEGKGPERVSEGADAESSGVFEIDWDRMDGIKGSRKKGTRACEHVAVVWRFSPADEPGAGPAAGQAVVIEEPPEGTSVPQMRPADWKGVDVGKKDQAEQENLGIQAEDFNSQATSDSDVPQSQGKEKSHVKNVLEKEEKDDDSFKGVKTSGPFGEEKLEHPVKKRSSEDKK